MLPTIAMFVGQHSIFKGIYIAINIFNFFNIYMSPYYNISFIITFILTSIRPLPPITWYAFITRILMRNLDFLYLCFGHLDKKINYLSIVFVNFLCNFIKFTFLKAFFYIFLTLNFGKLFIYTNYFFFIVVSTRTYGSESVAGLPNNF